MGWHADYDAGFSAGSNAPDSAELAKTLKGLFEGKDKKVSAGGMEHEIATFTVDLKGVPKNSAGPYKATIKLVEKPSHANSEQLRQALQKKLEGFGFDLPDGHHTLKQVTVTAHIH